MAPEITKNSKIVEEGMYAGAQFGVLLEGKNRNGKIKRILLPQALAAFLINQGANMRLLKNIGDQTPKDVLDKVFDSINF